ncbi:DUF4998 domain-containing protein [Chitinophaga sp. MM2321]|uniref:DUF4998 domain-containing protein n=1 Tax=Chitinophaga sp. MM2321 TaxID=3137178 RepID=UPI0032D5A30E
MKKISNILYILLGVCVVAGCTKMDQYLDYTGHKELTYTGKVDSLKALSGDDRIKLSWLLIADPKISGVTIYYNSKSDSVVIPVNRTGGIDSMEYLFSNMPEGSYSFEVYTWNTAGIRSVPTYITGRSYGPNYKSGLLNRAITDAELKDDGNAIINWSQAEETTIGMEVTFTNSSGVQHLLQIPLTESSTVLEAYQPGSDFSYRTLFRPDSFAIDTFYAAATVRKVDYSGTLPPGF